VWSERSAERKAGSRRAEDWRHSDLFSERERVALDYAEAVTRSDLEVTDELMARVKQQFDVDALVELTALIAFQGISSEFNAALDVAPQGFCRLPPPTGPWQNGKKRAEPFQSARQSSGRGHDA
jgi:alkylhydroperoxidase family enzyme